MPLEKTVIDRRFDPERIGTIYCPDCKGSGKLFNGVEGRVVCKICGGFGLILSIKGSDCRGSLSKDGRAA